MVSFRLSAPCRWLAPILVLAVATSWADPGSAAGRNNRIVRIGYNHSPPYLDELAPGKPTGIAAEVMEEASRRAGIRMEWVLVPGGPDEAFTGGLADLYPIVAISPQRKARYHISDRWILTHFCLLSLRQARVDGAASLAGRRVGHTNAPSTRGLAVQSLPKARFREYPSRDEVISGVCSGEVDAAFIETRVVESALLDRPEACREASLRTSLVHGAAMESGVGSTAAHAATADKLRAEIVGLARDGTMARIFSRWNVASSIDTSAIYDLVEAEDAALRMRWVAAALLLVLLLLFSQYVRARDARRSAESANSAKGEFLANMSHEIRTPLNGVVGLAAALADSPLPPQQKELVRDLTDCSDTLLSVINDILDFSKIEAGKLSIEYAPFDLHEAVRASAATQTVRARQKGLELEVTIAPGVPRWAEGDSVRIKQVLINLIGNAIKFTQKGYVRVRAVRHDNGEVEFTVTDTGIGLDQAALAKLFQAFTQADTSTTRKYGGTGLGLAISKRVTNLMGGTIGADSTPGKGSMFWFRIPLELANPPVESVPVPVPATDEAPAPRLEPALILVAEDNAVNRKVVKSMLEKFGFPVECVVNGLEAFEAVKAKRYGLVLMDCQMPEMDGYQATGEIRKFEQETAQPKTPIVALTAHAMMGDREKCMEAGMDDYVTKPIHKQVLLQTILRWIPEGSAPAGSLENLSLAVAGKAQAPEPSTRTP